MPRLPFRPGTNDTSRSDEERYGRMFDERFWLVYPLKRAREAARREFIRLKPDAELLARMLSALEAQKETRWRDLIAEAGDSLRFIPHARTWLHNRRWLDEAGSPPARAVVRGPAEWRLECRSLGHDPSCTSPNQHELRKHVAANGCEHNGICQSIDQHQQRAVAPRAQLA